MTGRRPVWLAEDASPALSVRRPLGQLARPAAGRRVQREVKFAALPPAWVDVGGHALAQALSWQVGPALWGQVVVEAFFTHEDLAAGLAALSDVPVARLNAALAMYDGAVALMGSAALLVASCRVLWPQTVTRAWLS